MLYIDFILHIQFCCDHHYICPSDSIGKEAVPESADNEINPSVPIPGLKANEHLPPSEVAAPVGTRAELRCSVESRCTLHPIYAGIIT